MKNEEQKSVFGCKRNFLSLVVMSTPFVFLLAEKYEKTKLVVDDDQDGKHIKNLMEQLDLKLTPLIQTIPSRTLYFDVSIKNKHPYKK